MLSRCPILSVCDQRPFKSFLNTIPCPLKLNLPSFVKKTPFLRMSLSLFVFKETPPLRGFSPRATFSRLKLIMPLGNKKKGLISVTVPGIFFLESSFKKRKWRILQLIGLKYLHLLYKKTFFYLKILLSSNQN